MQSSGVRSKFLILVTGMPGAGKTVFSRVASSMGVPVLSMGDVVRSYAAERGLPMNDASLGKISLELREKFGRAVIAERTFERLASIDQGVVVIEGLRNLEELFYFRERASEAYLVAIHASQKTRYERLRKRGRKDDPLKWEEFLERDLRELSVGLGSVIALADIMLVNEGKTEEEFEEECREALQKLLARAEGLR